MSTIPMRAAIARNVGGEGFRDILVASDLSDRSDSAIAEAAALATRFHGRLTLYHALEFPDHEYGHWAFGDRPGIWDHEERLAREYLAHAIDGLMVPHEVVVERASSPVRALLSRIDATAPDLTVMATHGRGALAHVLLGSVAERVAEHRTSPLLCLRGPGSLDRLLAGRIVVATDFSEGARAALRAATRLAGAYGGELVVVHAPGARPGRRWAAHEPAEPWRPYAAAERWLGSLPQGLTVRVVVDTARLLDAVLRTTVAERAGLVVMGRRSDTTVGNAPAIDAARLVRHAHCSVLVV
jgi:nucleotide-binding universal stress UspA family protein